MKCLCGASFRKNIDFERHYTSTIHKNSMNTQIMYPKCDICYNHVNNSQFIRCNQCRNCICKMCYSKILLCGNNKCPFCRYQGN